MSDDYADAAKHIIKVRFPEVKELPGGSWVQLWRVETDVEVSPTRQDLEAVEVAMAQKDFEVRVDSRGPRTFELQVITHEDARQGRFLFAIYRAIQLFDEQVGHIASIEEQPRERWTVLRNWSVPGGS